MYPIPGHLAFGVSAARLWGVSIGAAVLGSFMPDIVDKGLNDFLHYTPYGRHFMHSVTSCVLCSGAVWLILGRRIGLGWLSGHLTHLVGDLGAFTPLWMPFVRYDWPDDINTTMITFKNPWRCLFRPVMGIEFLMLILMIGVFLYPRSARGRDRVFQYGCFVGILILAGLRIWMTYSYQA